MRRVQAAGSGRCGIGLLLPLLLAVAGCQERSHDAEPPTDPTPPVAVEPALRPGTADGARGAVTADQVLERVGALELAVGTAHDALGLGVTPGSFQVLPAQRVLPPASGITLQVRGDTLHAQLPDAASAELELPTRADRPFALRDRRSGLAIEVRASQARGVAGELRQGYVVYPGAFGDGADLVHRPHADGTEDYVWFERAPAQPELVYAVALGADVAALRLVENTLLLLDADGRARLRLASPYLVDARGLRHDAQLQVSGCALDTATGRLRDPGSAGPLRGPGARQCDVHVAWSDAGALEYPILIDPSWTTTAAMATARTDHAAVLLSTGPDAGKVLVVGGKAPGNFVTDTAELYDPATPGWTPAASMGQGRQAPSVAKLADGRVLVAGGFASGSLASAEIYDPVNDSWSPAASMIASRLWTPATTLADGRVLVAGGNTGDPEAGIPITALQSAEVYNPTSDTWSATPALVTARAGSTATRLANGRVLVAGGDDGSIVLFSAQVYNPTTNAWTATPPLNGAHDWGTAERLPSGRVLLAAGWNGNAASTVAELYDPNANSWTVTAPLASGRWGHASAVLFDGRVLVATGSATNDAPQNSAEVYDPGTALWSATPVMQLAHGSDSTATPLPSSMVLLAGGAPRTTGVPTASAELYEPRLSNGVACTDQAQCISGQCVDGVCCNTACGGGNTSDCQACNVAAGAASNGTCGPRGAGLGCRPSVGVCDLVDTCNGTDLTCPANAVVAAGTLCRAATGLCDVAESCNGTSGLCPANGFAPSTTVCRATTDVCDAAETCTGSSALCPANGFAPSGTQCRAAAGVCDAVDACTGGSAACPADAKLPPTTTCRASTDLCDRVERCDGVTNGCPADTVQPAGVGCRAVAGACDIAEACNGVSKVCPANALVPAGTECRAVSGACDVAESCNGTVAACPANSFVAAGNPCRPSAGPCDLAEACNGAAAACPADARAAMGTQCRASVDLCDAAESCDGSAVQCPVDALRPAGTACRASAGLCDAVESCDGNGMQCPADALQPAGTPCRAPVGPCDVAEACTGSAVGCGADQAVAPGTACGAAPVDVCDAQDVCAGSVGATASCVPTFASPATECRAASCSGATESLTGHCDGAGLCPPAVTQSCGDYLCAASGAACATECLTDPDVCADTALCYAGACVDGLPQGADCVSDGECMSGFCVDGVCCDGACTAQCEACAEAGSTGSCVAVAGAPRGPRLACAGAGTACGGSCDGNVPSACTYPTDDTECRAGSCAANTAVVSAACDGQGTCPAQQTVDCGAFGCAPDASACQGDCAGDPGLCGAGTYCAGGLCVPQLLQGVACSGDAQCTSGHCVDAVCCASACAGQCQSCGEPGSAGSCVAVAGAPRAGRPACATDGSSCGGACDGTEPSECAYAASSVECSSAYCSDAQRIGEGACDGVGSCLEPAPETCAEACQDGLCVVTGTDAGPPDGGIDAGLADGGMQRDGGLDAGLTDGGAIADGGSVTRDADVQRDGSTAEKPDTGPAPGTEISGGSCGCRTVGAPAGTKGGALGWLFLVATALVARRRRR
jgi:hypothetical protein